MTRKISSGVAALITFGGSAVVVAIVAIVTIDLIGLPGWICSILIVLCWFGWITESLQLLNLEVQDEP